MVEIEYKGGNSVAVSTKKASLVIDPKTSLVGLKDQNVKGLVELATEPRFALNDKEAKIAFEGPGEYGVANFDIRGVAAQRHLDSEADPKIATMYSIEANDIRTVVLGNIYEKLTEDQYEALGVVDVLIIPVGGGGYTLDPTGAASIIRSMDPKAVVPVHYADPALTYEVPQLELDTFINELGAPVEEVSKLKFKNAAALPQALTVFKLARS